MAPQLHQPSCTTSHCASIVVRSARDDLACRAYGAQTPLMFRRGHHEQLSEWAFAPSLSNRAWSFCWTISDIPARLPKSRTNNNARISGRCSGLGSSRFHVRAFTIDLSLVGHDHAVDDVNHAVGCNDIGGGNVGLVYLDTTRSG